MAETTSNTPDSNQQPAPERFWIAPQKNGKFTDTFRVSQYSAFDGATEYIRADLAHSRASVAAVPSDAAMRAAEEIIGLTHSQDIDGGTKRITAEVAAIITRNLAAPAAAPEPGTLYWTKDADGYPILDAATAATATTTSPETPVGGEASDCMAASEEVLAREWDTPEEDEAWANLAATADNEGEEK